MGNKGSKRGPRSRNAEPTFFLAKIISGDRVTLPEPIRHDLGVGTEDYVVFFKQGNTWTLAPQSAVSVSVAPA